MFNLRKLFFTRQPIQNVLFLGFGGLILLAVAIVLYLALTSNTRLTKEHHRVLFSAALTKLNDEVNNLLLPVEEQADWTMRQISAGDLDIDNYDQVQTFLRGVLAATPKVTGAGFLYPDGMARFVTRRENNFIQNVETTPENTKRLFDIMAQQAKPVWGHLLWYKPYQQTIVDLRVPIFKDKKLEAVMFIGVTVADLSESIRGTSHDQYLVPFILYDHKYVLAHPSLSFSTPVTDEQASQADWVEGNGVVPLPKLTDFSDQTLNELITGPVLPARLTAPIKGVYLRAARINADMHIVATSEIKRFGERPWTIGVYINGEKSSNTVAMQLFQVAGAGLLVMIVSLVLSLKVGKKIARPVVRLAESAQSVRKGNLEAVKPLPRSRLRELDQAAQAFNGMVDGLRERDMIREVFGRYVPESVASSLMEESGELQPISTEATILFSDLKGFTRLTEEVGPQRIVAVLNAYFSDVVSVLERHSGVVTQFQGDAVLATFNVPISAPDHAECAIRAAMEIQAMLACKKYDGISLESRIGINTGSVVAGAVGAQGRLNYTVHGDAVNLAARIEGLNKDFGTNILISEHTAKLVSSIELEMRAQVGVRGQSQDVNLYVIKSSLVSEKRT